MTSQSDYRWRRDQDGLGVWEHRGKVAVAGVGHSPIDRRWDGVDMDRTLGAFTILACQQAMDEAGVTIDDVDGILVCQSHIAGASGGSSSQWAPRQYFDPPYDSEWGLTLINAQWLIQQMGFPNIRYAPDNVPTIRRDGRLGRRRRWATDCATPASSYIPRETWKAATGAEGKTPTITLAARASGPCHGGTTAATTSSTSFPTTSTASSTAAITTTLLLSS